MKVELERLIKARLCQEKQGENSLGIVEEKSLKGQISSPDLTPHSASSLPTPYASIYMQTETSQYSPKLFQKFIRKQPPKLSVCSSDN